MTVLDAYGREVDSERDEEQWLTHAMFGWLGDQNVAKTVMDELSVNVKMLREAVVLHLKARKPMPTWPLREVAYLMLQSRKVRRQIARVVLQDQREDYEEAMTAWTQETHGWLQKDPLEAGPRPLRPDPPLTPRQAIQQLQVERLRLEKLLAERPPPSNLLMA